MVGALPSVIVVEHAVEVDADNPLLGQARGMLHAIVPRGSPVRNVLMSGSMERPSYPQLGLLGVVATGAAAAYLIRPARRSSTNRSRDALVAYLYDHLSGSDAGLRVVRKLATSSNRPSDRDLFRRLVREFEDERRAVRALLAQFGSSMGTVKRAAGIVTGYAASVTAGGEPGDLSLLRTLEALTVAVQGKRCLWRALQAVDTLQSPHHLTFEQLEVQAVQQWEALDERRRALARRTFALAAVMR